MGVIVETIERVTCDICGGECKKLDGNILIEVNPGSRDVGPAEIVGVLEFNQPYGVSAGLVCWPCKIKYLKKYVEEHDK